MSAPVSKEPHPEESTGRESESWARRVNWRAALPFCLWLGLLLVPPPEGLTREAWSYFALFSGVILGLILEPIPAAAIGIIGVAIAAVMRLVESSPTASVSWALSGFSDRTVWLIFGAYVFSIGYGKTGLGRRIALHLVRLLGGRSLGLGYSIAFADLVLAPGTPSNTARSAGTIFPVICNIPGLYGSEPGPTARRIGGYIMWTAFAATAVTSSMFVTALAPNVLALSIVKQTTGVEITWTGWWLGFLPVGIVLLLLTPLLTYWIYPPEIKRSGEVPKWASAELRQMSRISGPEIKMAIAVLIAVFLWITGNNSQVSLPLLGANFIDATGVVLLVIALLLLARVLTWQDILSHQGAWNILVWFATLVTLADGLNRVGFIKWVTDRVAAPLSGFNPVLTMGLLVALFFFIHYFFASLSAHTAAVLPVVLSVGAAIPGVPVVPFALLLVYSLGLMGVTSPYATGPAPIYYACGFVARTDFWRLGLIFGLIFFGVLILIGIPWLV
ncbi:MAG: DASS family sodium-coupled anion symporter [Acidobacteria bacterium]|nr:MAG: DASS family sodium-coupled anion symporter [Acidobacteriota bacterium]